MTDRRRARGPKSAPPSAPDADPPPPVLERCSFCGTDRREVRWLVASEDARAFICDVCILLAVHALADKLAGGSAP